MENKNLIVIKKDGTREEFNPEKIVIAVGKSASRILIELTDQEKQRIVDHVLDDIEKRGLTEIPISTMHSLVEGALQDVNEKVYKSYCDYRNYKKEFVHMMDEVYKKSQSIRYIGDKDNANTDSALVATKRSLIFNELNKELYRKFFMTRDELQACKEGYIYVHDQSARLDTINCCLFNVKEVFTGGFEMGNIWYNEPKSLDTAFDVLGDVILSTAAQQYGGFTVPEVDTFLEPYAEKSFAKYKSDYIANAVGIKEDVEGDLFRFTDPANESFMKKIEKKAEKYADNKVRRDFEQGMQGIEYKLNTVGSSRGDYPFITFTFGLGTGHFAKMCSIAMMQVHQKGQGKEGFKRPVLFPKYVFLYDENIHGVGKSCEDVFEAAIECSSKTMYPDYLSLTGEGYVASIYKKYGRAISPMGCVDGKEVITYKFHNKLYVEGFERMWSRISSEIPDVGQSSSNDKNRVIHLDDAEVLIYDTKKGFVKVKKLVRNIQDNWCDVTIKNGRVLRTTTDHPFETENRGVVFAKDLTEDDTVAINPGQYSEETVQEDAGKAWLDGFLLCDGCYQNFSIFASVAAEGEDDIAEKFVSAFRKYYGLDVKTVLQERGEKGTYKDLRACSDYSGKLAELIEEFTQKYGGVQKKYRHIPNEVFSFKREAKIAFLAGMIDADGYVNSSAKHKHPTVQIGSTNKELAIQQMALAQSLGMQAKICRNLYRKDDEDAIRYRVEFFPTKELVEVLVSEKKRDHWEEFTEDSVSTTGNIKSVEMLDITQYSYDVTTESGHFEVSGVYSHNCRAFLSPWYERGGMEPADEDDKPVYIGRCNLGAVSLHLPMILAKARRESRDFYEVLDYYMEMIRNLHKRTYDYIGEMRASVNPTMFCEGGLLGGHLDPKEKIRKLLPPMTMSFGITALNELQELYNGKSLVEDNEFCLEVMKYINDKIKVYKEEDHILYAIYGTPAESLCVAGDTQIQTYTGNKCISEIVPGDLVYSFNEKEHKVELKKVVASRMTRRNAETVKVTFDNGQEVICTPNHEFAVRKSIGMVENGKRMRPEYIEYVAASKLKPGDRIKSNYIKLNPHTERLECSIYHNGEKQFIHDINAEYAYGKKPEGYVVHHKDGNKENNSFENLVYMSDHDHKVLHMDLTIGKHCYTSGAQTGEKNSFYGKHQTEENNLYNRKFHIYKPVIQKDIAGNVVKVYECIQDVKKDGYTEHLVRLACRGERHITDKVVDYHYYKDSLWYYGEPDDYEAAAEANHKVVSVTPAGSMDVYDIEVEDNHNFFVGGSNGILVHNCYLQIQQFRKEFGIIPNVSDRPYVSNSFHCHVTEDISPIQKQDREHEFWDYFNGGKIQYVRYPLSYNVDAVRSLVRRAMKMGFYEGVNLSLAYCDDCGHEELEMDVCPKCGSRNLTKIDRMNGYLAYSRKHGDTRLNAGKMAEIADRVSM